METDGQSSAEPSKVNPGKKPCPINFNLNHYNTSDFFELCQSPAFIDKTLLIRDLLEDENKYVLITAPSGFGKTTNMDMVRRFVQNEIIGDKLYDGDKTQSRCYQLFRNLIVFEFKSIIEHHFSSYLTLHVSFKDLYTTNVKSLIAKFSKCLHSLYSSYLFLRQSSVLSYKDKYMLLYYGEISLCQTLTTGDLELGIPYLVEMLVKHFGRNARIYIFIDDYDQPLIDFINDPTELENGYLKLFFTFFSNVFNGIINGNNGAVIAVERILFTGTTTFGSAFFPSSSTTTTLNNNNNNRSGTIQQYQFLMKHPYGKHYGLTPLECDELFKKFHVAKIHEYQIYNNYSYVTLDSQLMMCTKSLMYYLDERMFLDFHGAARVKIELDKCLEYTIIRYNLEKMTNNNWIAYYKMQSLQIDNLNEIKRLFTQHGHYDAGHVFQLFVEYLLQIGFFKIRTNSNYNGDESINPYYICTANQFIKNEFEWEICRHHSVDFNNDLKRMAYTIDCLTIYETIPDTFERLAESLMKIFYSYYNTVTQPISPLLIIRVLFDAFAKSKFSYFNLAEQYFAEFSKGFVMTFMNTAVFVAATYNHLTALDAIKKSVELGVIFDNYTSIENKIYLGFDIDNCWLVKIAWLINDTDTNNMNYWPS